MIGIIDLVDVEGYVFERLREENVFPIEVDFLCFYYFLGLYEMLLWTCNDGKSQFFDVDSEGERQSSQRYYELFVLNHQMKY